MMKYYVAGGMYPGREGKLVFKLVSPTGYNQPPYVASDPSPKSLLGVASLTALTKHHASVYEIVSSTQLRIETWGDLRRDIDPLIHTPNFEQWGWIRYGINKICELLDLPAPL